jgi:signal peptidase II
MRVQHRRPRLRLVFATAVAALVVDVVTKAIAVGLLIPGQRVPLIGDHVSYAFRSPGPLRGAVVDFVAIGWGPIFNAADVCVVVGVAILTWRLLADDRGPASA